MAIKCEMCGSTEVVKTGEYFECKYCGCKYSVEEIKRQMGVVTVAVENAGNVDTLRAKADGEYEQGDYSRARETYSELLKIRPKDSYALYRTGISDAYDATYQDFSVQQILNYCFRALEAKEDSDNTDNLEIDMASDLLELVLVIHASAKSIGAELPENRTSIDAEVYFGHLGNARDICEFIATSICPESTWKQIAYLNFYTEILPIWIAIDKDRQGRFKYADSYTQYDYGRDYHYGYIGPNDEAREAVRLEIELLEDEVKVAEFCQKMLSNSNGDYTKGKAQAEQDLQNKKQQLSNLENKIAGLKKTIDENKFALFGSKAKLKKESENEYSASKHEKFKLEKSIQEAEKIIEAYERLAIIVQ